MLTKFSAYRTRQINTCASGQQEGTYCLKEASHASAAAPCSHPAWGESVLGGDWGECLAVGKGLGHQHTYGSKSRSSSDEYSRAHETTLPPSGGCLCLNGAPRCHQELTSLPRPTCVSLWVLEGKCVEVSRSQTYASVSKGLPRSMLMGPSKILLRAGCPV